VALVYGGTGAITAAGARTNLGAIGRNAINIPAGTTYSFVHGLNTLDVIAAVVEVATGDVIFADVKVVDANTVSVTFGNAVAANAYRVVVIG
jgi:3-keto-L-gulonate-6-phosphate decarboxylase